MKTLLVVLIFILAPLTVLANKLSSGAEPAVSAAVGQASNQETSLQAQLDAVAKLLEQKDFSNAVRELKNLSRSHTGNADVWSLLGVASHKKGNFLGSMVAFEKSIKLNPDNRITLSQQADLFLSIGDRQSAQSNLDKLNQLCPAGCEQRDRIAAALNRF